MFFDMPHALLIIASRVALAVVPKVTGVAAERVLRLICLADVLSPLLCALCSEAADFIAAFVNILRIVGVDFAAFTSLWLSRLGFNALDLDSSVGLAHIIVVVRKECDSRSGERVVRLFRVLS